MTIAMETLLHEKVCIPLTIMFAVLFKTLIDHRRVNLDVRASAKGVGSYVGFATLSIWLFHFFSAGDISYVLTLSATLHVFASVTVLFHEQGESKGKVMSMRALELLMAAFTLRLSVTTRYQGYLPDDASGDGFFQACEFICLVLCGYMWRRHEGVGEYSRATIVAAAVPVLALSLVVRGDLNAKPVPDSIWAAGFYIETLAWLVQMVYCLKSNVAHRYVQYCIPFILDKLFESYFWYLAYDEIMPQDTPKRKTHGSEYFPPVLVAMCTIQILAPLFMLLVTVFAPRMDTEPAQDAQTTAAPAPVAAASVPEPVPAAVPVSPAAPAPAAPKAMAPVPPPAPKPVYRTPAHTPSASVPASPSMTQPFPVLSPVVKEAPKALELPAGAPTFGRYVPKSSYYKDGILTVEYMHVA